MNDRAQARLAELKQEYMTGEAQLRELMQQEVSLRETLLRISGAIQVLQEVLAEGPAAEAKYGPADDGSRPATDEASEAVADAQPPRLQVLTVP